MLRSKGFIFTNKEHTKKGIMSTILGILGNITLGIAVYKAYINDGTPVDRYGAAAVLAILFMTAGMALGLWSAVEKDKFRLFTVLGIGVNVLAAGMLSLILFAGAYVD